MQCCEAQAFEDGEVCTIAALNHTNIYHLDDVGPDYLVLEYAVGPGSPRSGGLRRRAPRYAKLQRPISTTINELGTGLGRPVGFFSVGATGSFRSVAIEKTWWVFGSSATVRAP